MIVDLSADAGVSLKLCGFSIALSVWSLFVPLFLRTNDGKFF
jgi:hypothetical protein